MSSLSAYRARTTLDYSAPKGSKYVSKYKDDSTKVDLGAFDKVFTYDAADTDDAATMNDAIRETGMLNMLLQQSLLDEARDNPSAYRARRLSFMSSAATLVGIEWVKIAKLLTVSAGYSDKKATEVADKYAEETKKRLFELMNQILPIDLGKSKHVDRDDVGSVAK